MALYQYLSTTNSKIQRAMIRTGSCNVAFAKEFCFSVEFYLPDSGVNSQEVIGVWINETDTLHHWAEGIGKMRGGSSFGASGHVELTANDLFALYKTGLSFLGKNRQSMHTVPLVNNLYHTDGWLHDLIDVLMNESGGMDSVFRYDYVLF